MLRCVELCDARGGWRRTRRLAPPSPSLHESAASPQSVCTAVDVPFSFLPTTPSQRTGGGEALHANGADSSTPALEGSSGQSTVSDDSLPPHSRLSTRCTQKQSASHSRLNSLRQCALHQQIEFTSTSPTHSHLAVCPILQPASSSLFVSPCERGWRPSPVRWAARHWAAHVGARH